MDFLAANCLRSRQHARIRVSADAQTRSRRVQCPHQISRLSHRFARTPTLLPRIHHFPSNQFPRLVVDWKQNRQYSTFPCSQGTFEAARMFSVGDISTQVQKIASTCHLVHSHCEPHTLTVHAYSWPIHRSISPHIVPPAQRGPCIYTCGFDPHGSLKPARDSPVSVCACVCGCVSVWVYCSALPRCTAPYPTRAEPHPTVTAAMRCAPRPTFVMHVVCQPPLSQTAYRLRGRGLACVVSLHRPPDRQPPPAPSSALEH